ncbi:DMT family transporter [Methylogaea oryzae]
MAWVVAGQLRASLVLDHYGWLGFAVRPVNWQRLVGAALLLGGAVLLVRH